MPAGTKPTTQIGKSDKEDNEAPTLKSLDDKLNSANFGNNIHTNLIICCIPEDKAGNIDLLTKCIANAIDFPDWSTRLIDAVDRMVTLANREFLRLTRVLCCDDPLVKEDSYHPTFGVTIAVGAPLSCESRPNEVPGYCFKRAISWNFIET
ncbi:hypothetical protein J6590_067138 [Homalodisca vitripennis]|nr:hypothetical protein J6590_067138 [Homalodisca vitripennis]